MKIPYSVPVADYVSQLYVRLLDQTVFRGLCSTYARDVIRSTEWLDARRKWKRYL